MPKTYPAKRSQIAKGFDFQGCTCYRAEYCMCFEYMTPMCDVCDEPIEDGQRIIQRWWRDTNSDSIDGYVRHSACSNEGGA